MKLAEVFYKENFSEIKWSPQAVLIADQYFKAYFKNNKFKVPFDTSKIIWVAAGEGLKKFESLDPIINKLVQLGGVVDIYALGGGSVGDAIGFLASVYKRGVKLIHIPSTWLAAVDSSHGGKTALNVGELKNQLGSFYPSAETWIVKELLSSDLVEKARGEFFKTLLLNHNQSWAQEFVVANQTLDQNLLWSLLPTLIDFKSKIVISDPYETKGTRVILNLGHTLGHVLELECALAHGEAVEQGLLRILKISLEKAYLSPENYKKFLKIFQKNKIEFREFSIFKDQAELCLKNDKKISKKNEILTTYINNQSYLTSWTPVEELLEAF